MKHRHPNATPSIVPAEHRQHGKCAQQLQDQCPPQDKPGQPDDPPDTWCGNGILHGTALHQGDFSPGQQRKGCRNGHNTKASYLDQRQNDRLPEARPIASGILHHKPCHADGRGRRKQRFVKGRYVPACCGHGQHQQQRPKQNNSGKTKDDDLEGRKSALSMYQLLRHKRQLPLNGFSQSYQREL